MRTDAGLGAMRRALKLGMGGAILCCALPACQSYERRPLDLPEHRLAYESRLADGEAIDAFAERLGNGTAAVETPDDFNVGDGLSPAEGEVVALFHNRDLRLARAQAGIAEATLETAGLWEDPEFGFDGTSVLSPESFFEYGLMVNLTIPVSGRLEIEKARAGAAYEAELRRIVDREWTTRSAVRSAWAAWTAAEERAALLRDVLEQVGGVEAVTDRLETAGELSRVEGRLFRVEMANRRAALVQAELEATRRRIALLGLMGLPADAAIDLAPGFAGGLTDSAANAELGELKQRLIEANTELAVMRAEYQAAEEAVRLEVRKQWPDITIGSGYGSEDGDDRLLMGVSIPIPILNANRAGIAEARARRNLARTMAETTYERLAQELAEAGAALEAARAQRKAYEAEVVPMLREQMREVREIAELGEVDTLLLLETVTREAEAKERLLDLRLAETEAAIAIERLLGPTRAAQPAPVEEVRNEPLHDPADEGGGE